MKFFWTNHALIRCRQRHISKHFIEVALATVLDSPLSTRQWRRKKEIGGVVVVYKQNRDLCTIITVYAPPVVSTDEREKAFELKASSLAKKISQVQGNPPPETEFLFMLNEALVRQNPPRKPSQTFKPSSLGGCRRNVYYQLSGADVNEGTDSSPEILGMAESGTDRHVRLQSVIEGMSELGYPVQWLSVSDYVASRPELGLKVISQRGHETKLVHDAYNMSFMCDGLILFRSTLYVLEVKTELARKWHLRTQPAQKAVVQGACYALCLGVPDILYVYENRDTLQKKVFTLHVTDEMTKTLVLDVMEEVNRALETQEPPPRTADTAECKYCMFSHTCGVSL